MFVYLFRSMLTDSKIIPRTVQLKFINDLIKVLKINPFSYTYFFTRML